MNAHTQKEPTWSVVVVYQNTDLRQQAVKFCNSLVDRFWQKQSFELNWWSFAQLAGSQTAALAADKAASADLIVFAARPETELPFEVMAWMESWVSRRGDREGELIGLLDPGAEVLSEGTERFVYLRSAAHRAGMDYLTEVPESIRIHIPDSLDSYSERADCVTSVLDEILHHSAAPPRL
jgi:hypothetical protein